MIYVKPLWDINWDAGMLAVHLSAADSGFTDAN